MFLYVFTERLESFAADLKHGGRIAVINGRRYRFFFFKLFKSEQRN